MDNENVVENAEFILKIYRMKFKDRTGIQYGRLIVIKFAGWIWSGGKFRTSWLYKCDCGNEAIIQGEHLQNGGTKSCGCLSQEKLKEKRQK